MRARWDRFWRDDEGNIVMFQAPNPPLWGWLLARIGALLTNGRWSDGLSFVAQAFLFTWAYLEVTAGVNGFRRAIGGGVLAVVVFGAF